MAEISPSLTSMNRFGLETMNNLVATEKGNVVISPASLYYAFRMAQLGAHGKTLETLNKVLGPIDKKGDQEWMEGLISAANSSGKLSFFNSMYLEKSIPFEKDFIQQTHQWLHARAESVDFKNQTEKVRVQINTNIEKETQGLIKDMIPAGLLAPATLTCLVNTLYMKASWEHDFPEDETKPGPFTPDSGPPVKVPMMTRKYIGAYAELAHSKAINFPYQTALRAEFYLPNKDAKIQDVLKDLAGAPEALQNTPDLKTIVDFTLPKFKIKTENDVQTALEKTELLGILSGKLMEFPGITKAAPLEFHRVLHKVAIELDEKGTEAAAATVLMARAGGAPRAPEKQVKFILDRPFLLVIRENLKGQILFLAYIRNPKS